MQSGKHAATRRVIRSNVFYSDSRFYGAGAHQFLRRIDARKRKKARHFPAYVGQICQIMMNLCIHYFFSFWIITVFLYTCLGKAQ